MKIMTIATTRDSLSALPPAERTKLNLASYEYALELKKKMGDKWRIYGAVGWGRAISIGEYDSLEEYAQTLQSPMAMAGYTNYESYNLLEFDETSMKAAIDTLKAAG